MGTTSDHDSLESLIRASVLHGAPVNPGSMSNVVEALVGRADGGRLKVLEVGGGRTPLFDVEACARLELDYWVNDISAEELSHLDATYEPTQFDIAGSTAALPDIEFDIVFSRSVLEHVADTTRALVNTHALLRPGGVAVHSFPTLYNPVYVVNRLIPERMSKTILRKVVKYEYEKFPALYDHTTSGDFQLRRMREIGFHEAAVVPFWGHGYLHFVPPIARLESRFAGLAERRDWRWYSTFAFLAGTR